jgi:hypothetical protein
MGRPRGYYMATNLGAIGALAAVLILAGCATTAGSNAAGPGVAAKSPYSGVPDKTSKCATEVQTFSGTDVNRTGSQNAGNALQILDPSVQIHH